MSKEQRDSFIFYRSFQDAINEMPSEQQLAIYRAIALYALDREEPELVGVPRLAWLLIRPQMDANWRKYEKGCVGAASGKKGGRPRKNPLGVISKTPNDNDNDNDNVNVNVLETTTTTPILSDIIEFVREHSLDVDPLYFYDYYSSVGWILGNKPMVDWRATLRIWSRNSEQESSTTPPKPLANDL